MPTHQPHQPLHLLLLAFVLSGLLAACDNAGRDNTAPDDAPLQAWTLSRWQQAHSLCSRWSQPNIDQCLSRLLVNENLFGPANRRLCDWLDARDPGLAITCRDHLAMNRQQDTTRQATGKNTAQLAEEILRNTTTQVCEGYAPSLIEDCRNQVLLQQAIDQGSLNACADLKLAKDRATCTRAQVRQAVAANPTFDCHVIGSDALLAYCNEVKDIAEAQRRGDPGQCRNVATEQQADCMTQAIASSIRREQLPAAPPPAPVTLQPQPDMTHAWGAPVSPATRLVHEDGPILVTVTEPRFPRSAARRGEPGFIRHPATRSGLGDAWQRQPSDAAAPFRLGKGIASGDIDKDGLPDLAVATDTGVLIYRNLGNNRFGISDVITPAAFNAFVVALVDLDNDDRLDLVASAYGGQIAIVPGMANGFAEPQILSTPSTSLVSALGFADLDQDGDLDMVVGRWSHGHPRQFARAEAANHLLINNAGSLQYFALFETDPPGQTNSILLADINDDGWPDILTGNDHSAPDSVLLSTGSMQWERPGAYFLKATPRNTASLTAADFNNDGRIDVFAANHARRVKDAVIPHGRLLAHAATYNLPYCAALPGTDRDQCAASMALAIAVTENDTRWCHSITGALPGKRSYCERTTTLQPEDQLLREDGGRLQIAAHRLLFGWRGPRLLDVSDAIGVSQGQAGWHARAFDANQDGFEDIYVTGNLHEESRHAADRLNQLFINKGGTAFARAEPELGLDVSSRTFTLLDSDQDGDVDMVSYSDSDGLLLMENRSNGNFVSIALHDQVGNSHCIGCRINITTGHGNQQRDIAASGGFLAYDEPVAYFGVPSTDALINIEVRWSTGETSVIHGPFSVNHHYHITRQEAP